MTLFDLLEAVRVCQNTMFCLVVYRNIEVPVLVEVMQLRAFLFPGRAQQVDLGTVAGNVPQAIGGNKSTVRQDLFALGIHLARFFPALSVSIDSSLAKRLQMLGVVVVGANVFVLLGAHLDFCASARGCKEIYLAHNEIPFVPSRANFSTAEPGLVRIFVNGIDLLVDTKSKKKN